MLVIKYAVALCMFLFVGCASVNNTRDHAFPQLKRFDDIAAIESFIVERKKAVQKIDGYPSKTEYWQKFKFWGDFNFWKKAPMEEIIVTGIRASEGVVEEVQSDVEFITNNQEALVDEGGIVKRVGDYMIVLRKGKLFSIHIGDTLKKVDEIAVQMQSWQHDAWYDELLADNGVVVVIGYSYDTDASEYLFFDIDDNGKFSRGQIQLVASSDYYSEDNYASRLVNGNFVFIIKDIPLLEYDEIASPVEMLNLMTTSINSDGKPLNSYELFGNHNVYSPIIGGDDIIATTVAVCPLDSRPFRCDANTVLGAALKESYVSSNAYYLWMQGVKNSALEDMTDRELKAVAWNKLAEKDEESAVYRIPFAKQTVGAVKLHGAPIDQFSFKESDGQLKLLSRVINLDEDEGYFGTLDTAGSTFYISIPLNDFNFGVYELEFTRYFHLMDSKYGWKLNRFVGDKLVFVDQESKEDEDMDVTNLIILDTKTLSVINHLQTEFGVSDIYPVGEHALLIDNWAGEKAVSFNSLALDSSRGVVDSLVLEGVDALELRSHAFNYKADNLGGIFAIPLDIEVAEGKTYKIENGTSYDLEPSTNMFYTRLYEDLTLERAGVLEGNKDLVWVSSDDCGVSCYDWYGSARPIFWGDRIFSLIKYELIEGTVRNGTTRKGTVRELQRLNFK